MQQILDLIIQPGIILEVIIAAVIIYYQIKAFRENYQRMNDYKAVFSESDTWDVEHDDMGQVSSITGGASNPFFRDIKDTINKYIAGNANSVMDFQIFKDNVDRQCDSIENQIESQTPVPLYLGLAGSMIGIIIGLVSLILDGSFSQLLSGNNQSLVGIGSLLLAVAVAMCASLIGILLTVWTTNAYKKSRSKAEQLKNQFMSWMQSTLFPALPNDISMAMTQLVSDLEDFNGKFEHNTNSLAHTFDNVNKAYKTQADIVSAVQKMDVQSMATANVRVLQELQKSTEKIERFNEYLDSIHGYTETIQKFNEQFHEDENQLGLLKQIRDFFKEELHEVDQRKQAIADAVSDVDLNLKNAFQLLSKSSDDEVEMLKTKFEQQTEQFKQQLLEQATQYNELLDKQKEAFTLAYNEICEAVNEKLKALPDAFTKLDELSKVPEELHELTAGIQQSMQQLADNYVQATTQMTNSIMQALARTTGKSSEHRPESIMVKIPMKAKIIGLTIGGLITVAVIADTVFVVLSYFSK